MLPGSPCLLPGRPVAPRRGAASTARRDPQITHATFGFPLRGRRVRSIRSGERAFCVGGQRNIQGWPTLAIRETEATGSDGNARAFCFPRLAGFYSCALELCLLVTGAVQNYGVLRSAEADRFLAIARYGFSY